MTPQNSDPRGGCGVTAQSLERNGPFGLPTDSAKPLHIEIDGPTDVYLFFFFLIRAQRFAGDEVRIRVLRQSTSYSRLDSAFRVALFFGGGMSEIGTNGGWKG